jgi:hypothetical protein
MTRATLEIRPRVVETPDTVRYEFELGYSSSPRTEILFYELARSFAPPPPDNFDGVLCAIIMHAMAEGRDIRLYGPATADMLLNLRELQLAWSRWRPEMYRPVEIVVDSVVNGSASRTRRAIAAFSGGVDSAFTLLRNQPQRAGPGHQVDTVLLVHGFDVSLSNPDDLQELVERTEPIRALTGAQLRIVRTNCKDLRLQDWLDSFGAQLAACMHLFAAEFSHALIASSESYDSLVFPLGSSPVTDHLLSGGQLAIVHDGAGFTRTDKIALLSGFPEAVKTLKVCWEGARQGRNCGVCEKCVRTQLNFLAVGVADPSCFDGPLDLRRIPGIRIRNEAVLADFRSIVDYADRRKIDGEWLRLLRARVRRGTRNWTPKGQVRTWLAKAGLLDTATRVRGALRRRRR